MKKMLLHVCCGPCATHTIETLKKEFDVTCFFYNPCIEPVSEYEKRLDSFKKVCDNLCVNYVVGDYDNISYREFVKGLETEPENGRRCLKCYELRLRKTAEYASLNGFDIFTTTLTISPHKNSVIIFDIANNSKGNVDFLARDFKKQNGFPNSVKISKELGIYRQNYCGCEFSLTKNIASPKE
jgi:predicted adenine nucleotide alpha hydrolase (AANH) superfamily ATPase